jgi:hypothetical protein
MTKILQHIALCLAFKNKFNNEDGIEQSLLGFRDKVLFACEGYQGSSQAIETRSESPPYEYFYIQLYILK